MGPLEAFDAIVAAGAAPAHAERVAEMKRAFEKRTGSFGPEDPWFEVRSRAFWDDAVARQGFARVVLPEVALGARHWVAPLAGAHRGLFEAERRSEGWILRDLWGGADFAVEHAEVGMRDALSAAESPLDARIVARVTPSRLEVAILPGAIFHREDARDAILKVVDAARARGLTTDEALDALLRMERNLQSLSRVKPGYAYRESALNAPR